MQKSTEKIECHTPTPGKKTTHILKWKYDIIAKTILELLPSEGAGIVFRELPAMVSKKLEKDIQNRIGSISWYTTTVKLDLECKKKIQRIPGSSPQRLVKNK